MSKTDKLLKQFKPKIQEQNAVASKNGEGLFLPNYSGIKDEVRKTSAGTIWTSANDGTGSGLDADTVDGSHASTFGNHLNLTNIGTNTHAQIDTHIAATGTSVHGLGSMSTQTSSNVSITGGSVTGITDVAIADGGTGASTALAGLKNLLGVNFSAQDTAPGSPTTDDLWYETDTNILWYWNGTYWLSEELFTKEIFGNQQSISVTSSWTGFTFPNISDGTTYNLMLIDMFQSVYVSTTNDGSNYWSLKLDFLKTDAGSLTNGTINTASNSPNVIVKMTGSFSNYILDMSIATPCALYILTTYTKVNSPGALYGNAGFTYRLVHA